MGRDVLVQVCRGVARGGGPGEHAAQQRLESAGGGAAGQAGEADELLGGRVEHRRHGRGLAARGRRIREAAYEAVDAGLRVAPAAGAEGRAAAEPGEQRVAGVRAVQVGDEREDCGELRGHGLGHGGGHDLEWGGLRVERAGEGVDAGLAGGEPALVDRAETTKVARRGAHVGEPGEGIEGPQVAARTGDPREGHDLGLGGEDESGAEGREGRCMRRREGAGRGRSGGEAGARGLAGGEQSEGVTDLDAGEQDRSLGGAQQRAVEAGEPAKAALQLFGRIVGLRHRGMIRRPSAVRRRADRSP